MNVLARCAWLLAAAFGAFQTTTAQELRITRVIDGDTFGLNDGRVVNLIGLRAPDHDRPRSERCRVVEGELEEAHVRRFEALAHCHAEAWLLGQPVMMDWRGPYEPGDTVDAYVWVLNPNGTRALQVNEMMVGDGFARPCLEQNHLLRRKLLLLQRRARRRHLGFWDPEREFHYPGAGEEIPSGCDDFSTQAEAQAFFEKKGGPEIDPYLLDTNRNGAACERLADN